MTLCQANPALVFPVRGAGVWLWLSTRFPGLRVAAAPAGDREDDNALVRRAVGGDRSAFDELYRRHVDLVWRRLTRILGQDPDREDLTQQIFLDVFRGLASFRGDAAFTTFLHRVVINSAYDHLKRRGKRPSAIAPEDMEATEATTASPETTAQHREQLALTVSLLDRIKPKKRIAFVLRVIEDLSLEEVATLVGSNVPTVAQRVRHAHDELTSMMERRVKDAGKA